MKFYQNTNELKTLLLLLTDRYKDFGSSIVNDVENATNNMCLIAAIIPINSKLYNEADRFILFPWGHEIS